VDVDGVLSDASGRQHLLADEPKSWAAFFEASLADPPISEGIRLVAGLVGERAMVLVTARPARLADTNSVPWNLLVMRRDGDHRSSPEVKSEALEGLRADGYEVQLALDDDPGNARMYQAAGVPTVYLHSGYYDL
jgi:hypothetical protein